MRVKKSKNNSRNIRLYHALIGILSAIIMSIFILFATFQDQIYLSVNSIFFWLSVFWVINITITFIFLNSNKFNLSPRSVTNWINYWALSTLLISSHFMPLYTTLFASLSLCTLIFGSFSLNSKQLFMLACFNAIGFAVILYSQQYFYFPELKFYKMDAGNYWFIHLGLLTLFYTAASSVNQISQKLKNRVRQLKLANKTIEKMAITDDLTGLYNRQHITELLKNQLQLHARNSSPFTIALVNMDSFKTINQDFGHQIGDRILIAFSHLIRRQFRQSDWVGRFSSEEFLILLPGNSLQMSKLPMERLRTSFEELGISDLPTEIIHTLSVGLAQYQEEETADELIKRAQTSLKDAKISGRNRISEQVTN